MGNAANVTSIALATANVVTTMASMWVEPSLDAVSEAPRAFVAGLQCTFFVIGGLLVLGVVISFLKGARPR